MGLFGQKPIYKCKILERFKIDPYVLSQCPLVGETPIYRIYSYKADSTSSTYLLRQEKVNPKKTVYLGHAKRNMCIYYDKIFAIDRINYTSRTYHPLYCTDISTGDKHELDVLSDKGCYIAMHWHCQDCVEAMNVYDEAVVLDVTRYKESSHYEEEMKYQVIIRREENSLTKEYRY